MPTAILCAGLVLSSSRDVRAQPTAKPEPAKPATDADGVEISLVTDEPGVALYSKETRKVTVGNHVAESWTLACTAPCNERVDPRLTYRVMGDDIIPSVEFHLAPGAPPVTLRVTPARPNHGAVGEVLAVSAGVTGLASVLLLLLDIAEHEAADAVGSGSADAQAKLQGRANTYGNIGVGFLGAGVVLGVTAFFLLQSGTTDLAPIAPASAGSQARREPSGIRLVPGGFAF
jgi:hypothetical protein